MQRIPLTVAVACLLAGGCRDTLAPVQFTGSYLLASVNGAALPATIASKPASCSTTIDVATLTLADGAFDLFLSRTVTCPSLNGVHSFDQIGGGLAVDGSTLTLRAIDPTSPSASVMSMSVTVAGSSATLMLPPGALGLSGATTMLFGQRQPL